MNFFGDTSNLDMVDAASVAVFLAVWLWLGWRIGHPSAAKPSVTVLMQEYRLQWMQMMAARDPRIFDAQIMMSLRQSTSFFASTCLLAMGGLLALIGNVDPLQGVATRLTNMESASAVLQVKLFLPLFMLGNAFLKFVWSNRVFGYCSVIMGAVPNDPADPQTLPMALKAGHLNARAALNFNAGLRSMYFALCALAWVAGAWLLLLGVAVTAWVVWSREFASASREIIMARKENSEEP
ncbi:DUF599 domain-containing protein [Roseibaca sp. V10]|uniref:DUF599 domain-containing protein n=1 Tax=Roseinatronobacter domitianus TaxID=2940293 RepID=A0ABT0M2G2_9RHOB|nr:DUF599 domain-containing protein [Roseibaca domitiana]MCL1629030.1 DUF599 domain-containing protein [Roseibaca domitiana]